MRKLNIKFDKFYVFLHLHRVPADAKRLKIKSPTGGFVGEFEGTPSTSREWICRKGKPLTLLASLFE